VFIHLTEVRNLLLWLTCFLDVHTTSQSWSDYLEKCEWQNGFSLLKKRAETGLVYRWFQDHKDPGAGGLVGVGEEGIASALS
jgi:hypothetical protein